MHVAVLPLDVLAVIVAVPAFKAVISTFPLFLLVCVTVATLVLLLVQVIV